MFKGDVKMAEYEQIEILLKDLKQIREVVTTKLSASQLENGGNNQIVSIRYNLLNKKVLRFFGNGN